MIYCYDFCGQLGNHLLTMINLVQFVELLRKPLQYNSIYMKYFFDITLPNYREIATKKTKVTIHSRNLVSIFNSNPNFSKEMVRKIATHTDIHIKQPFLGELFFKYSFVNPNHFIKIKPTLCNAYVTRNNTITIGIHIRDMGAWNKRHEGVSDLQPSYYIRAIEYCLHKKDELCGCDDNNNTNTKKQLLFILMGATSNKQSSRGEKCDVSHYPPYVETETYLKNNNIHFEYCITTVKPKLNFIYDWYQLSQCDVIISSAGTFAISAGILGKPHKKIIHSKEWVEYAAKKHDTFWKDLYDGGNQYYQLWRLI